MDMNVLLGLAHAMEVVSGVLLAVVALAAIVIFGICFRAARKKPFNFPF
ncbi:MAG TPA: hypothetical protein VFK07_01565 [Candidatus Paceibacterota bacterium]|nr:hypothetical protein [Candidatus Paceibacterota bacterium]